MIGIYLKWGSFMGRACSAGELARLEGHFTSSGHFLRRCSLETSGAYYETAGRLQRYWPVLRVDDSCESYLDSFAQIDCSRLHAHPLLCNNGCFMANTCAARRPGWFRFRNHARAGNRRRRPQARSKPAKDCVLCYLGTATYDLAANREKQVSGFRSRGVAVEALDVARMPPTPGAVEALLARADIVLVSGGNTLFAVDRWKRFGLDEELRKGGGARMRADRRVCGRHLLVRRRPQR